jgi:hypothetical protein
MAARAKPLRSRRPRVTESDLPVVISHPEELRAFVRSRDFFGGRPLVVRLSHLSPQQALAGAERLNRERQSCGCGEGALAMAAVLVLGVVLIAVRHGPLSVAALVRYPLAALAAMAAMGVGKALGLALAHRRARRLCLRLAEGAPNPT